MGAMNPTLLEELQKAPLELQQEVLDFLLFIKKRRGASPSGVERSEGICGGEARIVGTRIPVWSLEQGRRLGFTDDELLANYPSLRRDNLVAAWAYVAAHPAEIEQSIRDNEAA
jgi:uncharacterized protein (DUF433 family)